jgi:hypothetical protein
VSKSANKLTAIIVNTQSIKSKTEMIWEVIDTRKPEIVVVSETWLNNNIHNSEVLPTHYEVYRKDRKDGYGGVLIAVNNTLISQDLEIKSDCEIVGTRIKYSKNTSLIVISVYRPPNNDETYAHAFANTIIDICNKYTKDTIWVGGDMNLPDIDWEENTITGNQYKKEINELLKSTIDDAGLVKGSKFPH